MNNHDLESQYRATEEDMQFAIGLIQLSGAPPAPILQIHYRDWTREKLEVIRQSFTDGLILVNGKRQDGEYDLFIGTREQVALQSEENGHMSVLRGPAWDAHLPGVDASGVYEFEANRQRYGGFLLLVQTPDCEFLTAVDNEDRAIGGAVLPREMELPRGSEGGM